MITFFDKIRSRNSSGSLAKIEPKCDIFMKRVILKEIWKTQWLGVWRIWAKNRQYSLNNIHSFLTRLQVTNIRDVTMHFQQTQWLFNLIAVRGSIDVYTIKLYCHCKQLITMDQTLCEFQMQPTNWLNFLFFYGF